MPQNIERELKSYKFLIKCIKTRCNAFMKNPKKLGSQEHASGCFMASKHILEIINSIENEIKTVNNSLFE